MDASSAFITLPSGEIVELIYTWTFGEMAITSLLIMLTVIQASRWLYDVMLDVWKQRKAIIVEGGNNA